MPGPIIFESSELTEYERTHTVHLFDKPYHWQRNALGKLYLVPGPTEADEIRWKVVEKLLEKGVDPSTITAEMIDKVIASAESRAIMEEIQNGRPADNGS